MRSRPAERLCQEGGCPTDALRMLAGVIIPAFACEPETKQDLVLGFTQFPRAIADLLFQRLILIL